jgi:hypothetical protein
MTNAQDISAAIPASARCRNEPVTLHEGPVLMRQETREGKRTGRLVLRFVPFTGLRLEAKILSCDARPLGAQVKAEIAPLGECVIKDADSRNVNQR